MKKYGNECRIFYVVASKRRIREPACAVRGIVEPAFSAGGQADSSFCHPLLSDEKISEKLLRPDIPAYTSNP